MKTSIEKWWWKSVVGFFSGSILSFLLFFTFIPGNIKDDHTGDLSLKLIVILFGVLYLIAASGVVLTVSAWINRTNRNKMLMLLIPGLLILAFAFLSTFGGMVVG